MISVLSCQSLPRRSVRVWRNLSRRSRVGIGRPRLLEAASDSEVDSGMA